MNITEAKWYKALMPKLYGWGAAVVILGALFKIEGFPGASYMLIAGLGLESIIFFFSAFEKQHEEPDWSLVYPELANMEDPNSAKRPAQQFDDALAKAKIDNELVESLNEGLRAFGESAKQLNETISAAAGISEYNEQIQEGIKNYFKKESKSLFSENNLNTNKIRDELEKQSVRRLKRAPQRIRYYKKSD